MKDTLLIYISVFSIVIGYILMCTAFALLPTLNFRPLIFIAIIGICTKIFGSRTLKKILNTHKVHKPKKRIDNKKVINILPENIVIKEFSHEFIEEIRESDIEGLNLGNYYKTEQKKHESLMSILTYYDETLNHVFFVPSYKDEATIKFLLENSKEVYIQYNSKNIKDYYFHLPF